MAGLVQRPAARGGRDYETLAGVESSCGALILGPSPAGAGEGGGGIGMPGLVRRPAATGAAATTGIWASVARGDRVGGYEGGDLGLGKAGIGEDCARVGA